MDELESIEDSFTKSELQRYAELMNYRILMGRKVHYFTGLFSQTSNIDFSVLKTRSLDQRLIASPSLGLCKALGIGDEYAKFEYGRGRFVLIQFGKDELIQVEIA